MMLADSARWIDSIDIGRRKPRLQHVKTSSRHIVVQAVQGDDELFEEKMRRLVGELNGQFVESTKLDTAILSKLEGLGYGG